MSTPEAFDRCIAAGGVAVFPADTVYGLACDPENPQAIERLYALKGRPTGKPSAVMWFDAERALHALPELGPRTRATMEKLLPGGVTLLLPNPRRRFPLAGGEGLGVRVPEAPLLRGSASVVMQSSANLTGGSDARRLDEVPAAIRQGADLVLDAGELPGTPSTVIDLRSFEATGEWAIVRPGAVTAEAVEEAARAGTVGP
jgi:L-threonylcarbamoyladenylate synthase